MTLYFNIHQVLDRVTQSEPPNYTALAPVATMPEDVAADGDEFVLRSRPSMLDLNLPDAVEQLSHLISEVSLYRYNIELLLDDALTQQLSDSYLRGALITAFADQPLPSTLHPGTPNRDDLGGSLHHPMLEHLTNQQLAKNYLAFWRALGGGPDEYGFVRGIIGRHEDSFLKHFDGFLQGTRGKVRADTLLGFGVRIDQSSHPHEGYVESGKAKARKMRVSEPNELLWAWLEADNYQLRRCRDIDALMQLSDLPHRPAWIRTDVSALLEREAMKQVFAEALAHHRDGRPVLEKLPAVRRAVLANAEGQVDELLQQLLTQTLGINSGYSGAAGKFADAAERRRAEAKRS